MDEMWPTEAERRWWRRTRPFGDPVPVDGRKAAALAQRVASTPWREWPRLDVHVRRSPYATGGSIPHWWTVTFEVVPAVAAATPGAGLLLTMHPDGHVRQAAVELLAATGGVDALPALLVRTTDWVPEVRAVAIAAVDRLVAAGLAADTVVHALPLLDQLAAPDRRGARWVAEVRDRLVATLGDDDLVAALGRSGAGEARAAARELVARGALDDGVVAAALAAGDDVVARTVARAAFAADPDDEAVLARLAASRLADLRATALHHRLTTGEAAVADAAARSALLDRASLVRALAQRHLARAGVDLVALHRTLLADDPRAVRGLAEVGGPDDADVVVPLLDDPEPRVRALALLASCRLRPADGPAVAVPRLQDPEPVITAAARRALRDVRLPPATVDLLAAAVADSRPHARRALVGVLHDQDRWDRLVVALRLLRRDGPDDGDPDDDLRARAEALLGSVRAGWNQTATAPSPVRLAEARALVADPAVPLPADDRADLEDVLRPWP
jgi:hypothetical protein